MNRTNAQRKKNLWTLSISIGLHLILLLIFASMAMSKGSGLITPAAEPETKLTRIKKLIDSTLITPKPKVHPLNFKNTIADKNISLPLSLSSQSMPSAADSAVIAKLTPALPAPALSDKISCSAVEFFGSRAYDRKICYVVDCSGSMQGLFSGVRQNLKQSIEALKPDQYFSIIFFGSGRLYKFNKADMARATTKSKFAAYKFIDSVRPAGTTNSFNALTAAMRIRDAIEKPPELIYFLTDGFDLTDTQDKKFPARLLTLKNTLAPGSKINTIGFWTAAADCQLLKDIARQTGGTFTLIGGDENE